jgi:hypothetical protein
MVVLVLSAAVGWQSYTDAHALDDFNRVSFVPSDDGLQKLALATGTLNGDRSTGCLWLENNGRRSPLVIALDDAGVDFQAVPPVVRTRDGVLARFGDTVSAGGGSGSPVAACATLGQPFRAWSLNVR